MNDNLIDTIADGMAPEVAKAFRKSIGKEETIIEFSTETLGEPRALGEHKLIGPFQDIRTEGEFRNKGFALRTIDITKSYRLRWEVVTDSQGCQVLVCYRRSYKVTPPKKG